MTSEQRTGFNLRYNLEWFKIPGFDDLYGMWSEILSVDEQGRKIHSPTQAIYMHGDTNLSVKNTYGIDQKLLDSIGRVARSYATTLPDDLVKDALGYNI